MKLALHLFEQSLCRCGHSSFLAHGREGVGEFDTQTVTCHACGETARQTDELKPGQIRYTVDRHDDPRSEDEELPEPTEGGDDDG
jgi:uncharacterized Zn finger protein